MPRSITTFLLFVLVSTGCGGPKVEDDPTAARGPLHSEGLAGAETCRECHQTEYDEWARTTHGRAMAEASPSVIVGDFTKDTTHVYDGTTYHMSRQGDTYTITARGPDDVVRPYPVQRVLGARQHQVYLTQFPDGRWQLMPVYWDMNEGRWYDFAEGSLMVFRAFKPEDWLYWTNGGRTWNSRCYDCHASHIRKNYDPKADRYNTVVGDLRIDCESCHGPGVKHVDFWRKALEDPTAGEQRDTTLVKASTLSPRQQVEICAQCHAMKLTMREGFVAGKRFKDYFDLYLVDYEPSFWPDGQIKQVSYEYLQFTGSACFRGADITCTTCHGPHGGAFPVDLTSDPAKGGLCGRCHPDFMTKVEAHTHHRPASPGSSCVACHMPRLRVHFLNLADHRITAPVPDITTRLGAPNACNQPGCHADKTSEWASQKARAWYGDYQAPRLRRAEAVALGRKGDRRALPVLHEIVANPHEDPLLRAGTTVLLAKVRDPSSIPLLIPGLRDTNDVVRSKAALALGEIGAPEAIPGLVRLLKDPALSVRIRAGYALSAMDFVPGNDPDRAAYEAALEEHEGLSRGVLADASNTHATIGWVREMRRQYPQAAESYAEALRQEPGNVAAGQNMTRMAEELERYRKFEGMVTPVLDKDPRLGVILGAARVERGISEGGVELLRKAEGAGIVSEVLQAGLGNAYRRMGRFDEAEKHYRRALEVYPKLAGAHWGLALIAFTQGRTEDGRKAFDAYLATRGDEPK